MTPAKPQTVDTCTPSGEGPWFIRTTQGGCGTSPTELKVGTWVIIRDGLALPVREATHV